METEFSQEIIDTPTDKIIIDEKPQILEEIQIEELAIDGICGVY